MATACPRDARGLQRFRVYVLELPDGSLYVGVTAKPVQERVREHRMGTGARSGRARDVVRLRRDLSPPAMCATRERAVQIEQRTAERLRRLGWKVSQS